MGIADSERRSTICSSESSNPQSDWFPGRSRTHVNLKNRALLAEVRKEIAELENRIIARINGAFVREAEGNLGGENMHGRIDLLAAEVRSRSAAAD